MNIDKVNKIEHIAIYCRVSTIEQAEEGYSIDEQERLLRDWCNRMNYSVYKVYSDRGISGKDIKNRPALKELLKDAEERKFQMVISWKINRISRKLSDVLKIVDVLEQNNIAFNSYSEQFEYSSRKNAISDDGIDRRIRERNNSSKCKNGNVCKSKIRRMVWWKSFRI